MADKVSSGQVAAGGFVGLFPGQDFPPDNLPPAGIGFGHGGVQHPDGGPPDIRAGAVAFNIQNDGIIRDLELAGPIKGNFFAWERMLCLSCCLLPSNIG